MSSKASAIYSELNTLIPTLLGASAKEIPDPYDIENNDLLTLTNGWAILLNEGNNQLLEANCLTYQRNFELILTRKTFSGNIKNSGGVLKRKEAETALLDDQDAIIKKLQSDTYLSTNGYVNLMKVFLTSDTGFNYLSQKDGGILVLRSRIETSYHEKL